MSLFFKAAKLGLAAIARPHKKKFLAALSDPKAAQEKVLNEILKVSGKLELPNQPTVFSDYPANFPWTREEVLFYEYTSGSSGLKKPIPYTRSLLKSFERMFILWANDLCQNFPLNNSHFFMAISPHLKSMGMKSDLDYLNPFLQFLTNSFLITKKNDFTAQNGEEFLSKISYRLLQHRKLELISVWSPTYFIAILDWIHQNHQSFNLDTELQTLIKEKKWPAIWPHLRLISCWMDASSKKSAMALQALLPNASYQAKGLLSTEGPVTMPWYEAKGCVPLWNEVYLEILRTDGSFSPLYEIKTGEICEIVMSTHGGLLRYRLGDMIQCTHSYRNSPVLSFVARTGDTSDLVGEKLEGSLIEGTLFGSCPWQWTLVPNSDHYVLVSEKNIASEVVEEKLMQIFHYALARNLTQLHPVRVHYLEDFSGQYLRYNCSLGQKVGDIKLRSLWPHSGFLEFLGQQKSP